MDNHDGDDRMKMAMMAMLMALVTNKKSYFDYMMWVPT